MHRQSSIYSISKDEVLQLSLLLDSGMDMHTLIQIAFRSSEAILQALNQGESFRSILCKYQRTHFFKLLNRMLESLDLKCAIDCVKNIESVTNDLFQKVLKKSAYPIFLYIFSLIMLIFFSDFVLVQMGEYANGSALLGVLTGLKFVFIFVSFVFCCFLICCVFLYYGKCLWMLRLDIVKKICTLKFVYIFQALIGVSLSTMEALNLMASMEDWLIKFYANVILDHLKIGKSMEWCFSNCMEFDVLFRKLSIYGIQSNRMIVLLDIYCLKAKQEILTWMNRFVLGVQLFSYMSIGVLVLAVYQVMLMPLNMLNTF